MCSKDQMYGMMFDAWIDVGSGFLGASRTLDTLGTELGAISPDVSSLCPCKY